MKLLPRAQVLTSVKTYVLPAYRDFPNSEIHKLPLVIYRPFEDADNLNPSDIEELLSKNSVQPAWRYGMFSFDHFHSNTHEILVPYQGEAQLSFGHHSSPDAVKHHAKPGDVYILPAGISHRSLSSSSDFMMVGSYPSGSSDWDTCKGDDNAKEKTWKQVEQLGKTEKWPAKDPIYGCAFDFWRSRT